MPNKMTQSNWVNGLTQKEQEKCYNEIVSYFTETILSEVLMKYDNLLDLNSQTV